MTDYRTFLTSKHPPTPRSGFPPHRPLNPALFDWQAAIVAWAVEMGTPALFEDCGLGKSLQQLEWAQLCHEHAGPGSCALIVAPLAVVRQTQREGEKFGYDVNVCRTGADLRPGLNIINYDRIKEIDAGRLVAVVLDESSCLKAFTGATRRLLQERFSRVPYRLCATATPAPNDHMELGNHAEFLGLMRSQEMLMRWFINNSSKAGDYRLMGHAAAHFWQWMTSWAVSLTRPSDLGPAYSDAGYELPELHLIQHSAPTDPERAFEDGRLFHAGGLSATKLWKEKAASAQVRCEMAASLVTAEPDKAWVVWCDTNAESDLLADLLPDAVEVRGSEKPEAKAEKLHAFSTGQVRIIITKCEIAGHGLNWQHSARACFVGLTYSYEAMYQALRRQYRFGQARPVHAHLIVADSEGDVALSLDRKRRQHQELQREMAGAMRRYGLGAQNEARTLADYNPTVPMTLPVWLTSQEDVLCTTH